MHAETEAEISQWAEGWWGMAQHAGGFCNSGKPTRRTGKKSLFSLYPHRSPRPSLARTARASAEEDGVRAEHGVGSTHRAPQIRRLAERPSKCTTDEPFC